MQMTRCRVIMTPVSHHITVSMLCLELIAILRLFLPVHRRNVTQMRKCFLVRKTSNDFTSFAVEAQARLGIHTDRLAGSCLRHQSDQQHQAPPIMVAIRVTNWSADIAPV